MTSGPDSPYCDRLQAVNVAEYISDIKQRLLTDPLIAEFSIRRERVGELNGYLRALATLSDGSWLELSEYVRVVGNGKVEVVTYSYHWGKANGELIRRWDNTPHFRNLLNFPDHVHMGAEDNVLV